MTCLHQDIHGRHSLHEIGNNTPSNVDKGASIGQVGPPTVSSAIRRTSVEVPMGDEGLLHRHPDDSEQSPFTIATMSPTDTPFCENGQRGGMGLSALDSGLLEHMARNRIVGEVVSEYTLP